MGWGTPWARRRVRGPGYTGGVAELGTYGTEGVASEPHLPVGGRPPARAPAHLLPFPWPRGCPLSPWLSYVRPNEPFAGQRSCQPPGPSVRERQTLLHAVLTPSARVRCLDC